MEESTIKNDKDYDVTVTYKDGDEDKEVVVKAGEEVTVPTEVAEEVTTQIADSEAPSSDDDNSEDDNKDEDANSDEDKKGDDENEDEDKDDDKKALAKANLKVASLTVEKRYAELLSAGKVIPAQKDRIMGLAKLGAGIELSTEAGKKIDLASVVFDILEAGNVKFSTDENGSNKEDEDKNQDDDSNQNSDEDKKPSETLSEAELAGFKAVGADVAKMDEMAEKDPVFREALANLSKKYNTSKKGKK